MKNREAATDTGCAVLDKLYMESDVKLDVAPNITYLLNNPGK